MLRQAWVRVATLVHHPRRRIGALALTSALAGLLEAAVLVLVVRVAVGFAADDPSGIHLPWTARTLGAGATLAVAAGAAAAVVVLHVAAAARSAALASEALVAARERAIRAHADSPWVSQHDVREGSLHESVGTLALNSSQMVHAFAMVITSAVALAALLVVAAVSDPVAMGTVVLLGAALTVCLRPIGAVARRRSKSFVESNTAYVEEVAAFASLAAELRSFGVQHEAAARVGEHHRAVAQAHRRMRFAQRLGWTLYRDVAVLVLIGAVAAVHLAGRDRLDGAGVAIALVVRSLASAQALQRNALQLHELVPSFDVLDERLTTLELATATAAERMPGATTSGHQDAPDAPGAARPSPPHVSIRGLRYEHRAGSPTLRGLDLEVEPGTLLAVVGPSGAGKTTLLQLLAGLRSPAAGTITVDGVALDDIDPVDWHRSMAIVPQEPRLVAGTVADNIRFFRADVDEGRIREVAALARVGDEIERLPQGFETALGPRGLGLSGGQRQRLALARALAGRPRILLLDEPTSALDPRSEELVVDTLRTIRGTVTVIVVAHRESTALACDRIVELVDGRVAAVSARSTP